MEAKDELIIILNARLESKGLKEEKYTKRLALELKEIDAQNKHDYFLDLHKKQIRYPYNQKNLLIPYLLGIVDDLEIDKEPTYVYGDMPDSDCDFLPEVRDYLKNIWAPKFYGQEFVANIGSYNTFGIKSALQNMARVYSCDKDEVTAVTKKLGLKDDEGKTLTWDKAVELFPEMKKYCEDHPEVATAAKKLLHRNNSMGKHAGGLIISSKPINNFVPLVKDKDDLPCTAWVEGLHGQDLGPVGLVKFDLLSLSNLKQIAIAKKLVKDRHGLTSICAKPGKKDWSDTSYLNAPKSIEMANKADLRGIFQFDSEGMRQLVKKGGVDGFNDLMAYLSVYRPGAIAQSEVYIKRKKGEAYGLHPLLKPILGETYGCMIYQEQIMRILNQIGDVPLKDCEIVRKAISKKRLDLFQTYKNRFIENGMKRLGYSLEKMNEFWTQIEAFSGYSFNKCLHGDSVLYDEFGIPFKVREAKKGMKTGSLDKNGKFEISVIEDVFDNGEKSIFELITKSHHAIKCTEKHKFLTDIGWIPLSDLKLGDWVALPSKRDCVATHKVESHELIVLAGLITEGNTCHPSSLYFFNQDEFYVDDFVKAAKKFGKSHITKQYYKDKWVICINSGHSGSYKKYVPTNLLQWARKNDLCWKKAPQKFLPDWVFQLSSKQIMLLLGRMWEGDGCVDRSNTYYATSSLKLAEQVQELLLRIGFVSVLNKKFFNYRGMRKIGYIVKVGGYNWRERFAKSIGKYMCSKKCDQSFLYKYSIFCNERDMLPYNLVMPYLLEIRKSYGRYCLDKCGLTHRILLKDKNKKSFLRKTIEIIAKTFKHVELLKIVNSNIFWTQVKSIKKCGKDKTYDICIKNNHNYIANGILVHNSHSCGYCVIAMRLLYFKAHYPIEFYTSSLVCEDKVDKLKEYKMEAELHNIKVNPIDISKSKAKAAIVDEEIYYGISNIVGIGDAVVQRVVDNQPYNDFDDFLNKFGTDTAVLKPLIGLRIFGEDVVHLLKYAEWVKKSRKRIDEKRRRWIRRQKELKEQIEAIVPEELWHFPDNNKEIYDYCMKNSLKKGLTVLKNYYRGLETSKTGLEEKPFVSEEYEIADKILENYESLEASQLAYYGFLWDHPLSKSPDYCGGMTFEDFKVCIEENNPVELRILTVKSMMSKKNNTYWLVEAEDANSEMQQIQVWKEDFERFKEEIIPGKLLRMRLKGPSGGFRRFTFESPPKWERHKVAKRKEDDIRLCVLRSEHELVC